MLFQNFLRTIDEVRRALQFPRTITESQLREWVQVASSTSDFWLRSQLAEIIGELHPGQAAWGNIVLGWLYDAMNHHSMWTDELVIHVLRGWPALFLRSALVPRAIRRCPARFAAGVLEAIRRRAVHPCVIPHSWMNVLSSILMQLSRNERSTVAKLLLRIHGQGSRRNRWSSRRAPA